MVATFCADGIARALRRHPAEAWRLASLAKRASVTLAPHSVEA